MINSLITVIISLSLIYLSSSAKTTEIQALNSTVGPRNIMILVNYCCMHEKGGSDIVYADVYTSVTQKLSQFGPRGESSLQQVPLCSLTQKFWGKF